MLKVKNPRRAVTIYDKMQILKFADKVEQEAGLAPKRKVRGKKPGGAVAKRKIRGLNLQLRCRAEFGALLGGMKVSTLRKRCKEQRWHELPDSQQRKMFSLTDEAKKALGLTSFKGYKHMTEDDVHARIEKNGAIQRWSMPGEILKDR